MVVGAAVVVDVEAGVVVVAAAAAGSAQQRERSLPSKPQGDLMAARMYDYHDITMT